MKAKICERLELSDLFEDAESSASNQASFSNLQVGKLFKLHESQKLLLLSGLSKTLEREKANNVDLYTNWSTASDWKETKRYSVVGSVPETMARRLVEAIEDPTNGIVPWIKKH